MKLALVLLAMVAIASPFAGAAEAADTIQPSFDCGRAQAEDETAICSSRKLAELDVIISEGYAQLQRQIGKKEARRIAGPLLKRRQACGSDMDCIGDRQVQFIKALIARGAAIALPQWMDAAAKLPNEPLPKKVGQCARTTINDIGGRLMGDHDFSSGTSVVLANGGYGVSYDPEQAIIASRLGDPVTICLARLPEDCPPGDERGKEYKTTNTRTGKSWTLPDAQHSCGGA